MDIISSLNTAFTQTQRSESMSFATDGTSSKRMRNSSESTSTSSSGNRGVLTDTYNESPMRAAVQNAVNYNRSESGMLQLRTQEGDLVTMRFMNSEGMNAQNRQFEGGGSVVSNFAMSGSDSSQFQVVVEGDLSGEELSAIRSVLIQAREVANTFYDGDVKEAFGMASKFNLDSEQLADISLDLKVTENYTYSGPGIETQTTQTPPSPLQGPRTPLEAALPPTPPVAAPSPIEIPAAIAIPVNAPDLTAVAPANEPAVSQVTQEAPFTPPPLETLVHSDPDSATDLNSALSTIKSFLNQLTSSINSIGQSAQGQNTTPALAFSGGFQLQVVSSMVGQLESQLEQPTAPVNNLASKTIDLLAQRMDARFDAMV
ncbi:MAG: hypothetical protein AB8G18_10340 [Gammaproteobacteria bacterium]